MEEKKKIIFYYPDFNVGGVETAIINLAQRIYKKYDLYFFYSKITSIDFAKQLSKYGICRNISLPQQEMKCDFLIYCSMWLSKDKELEFIKPKKRILWFHAIIPRGGNRFYDLRYMKKVDYVIGVSDAAIDSIPYYLYREDIRKKVKKINNIVNTDIIKEKTKEEVDLELARDLNICTVARISHEKGWHRIMILCKELEKLNIDFKWFIIGYGYFQDQIDRAHSFLKDVPEVVWYGGTPNPFPIVKQMDYSALLSDYESWGMSITEAKILGVPPIATDFKAATEQIENGTNGYILPMKLYGNYKDYAKKLVENKILLKKSLINFDYEKVNQLSVDKWEKIFNEGDVNKNEM